jgi:hypothetical protein
VERFHRLLKAALWVVATDWNDHLPWAFLGLCYNPREDSGDSPAETIFIMPDLFIVII